MKLKNVLFVSTVIFFSWITLVAQVPNVSINKNNSPYCATDALMKSHPKLELKQAKIDQKIYADFIKKEKNTTKNFIPPPYILPIVVHIIHQNGIENISDAQVLQGIADLNEAYANINYYDQNTGVNTKIQFCLAKQTPEGNATTGINRALSPLTNMTLETDDIALKNLSRRDPYHYINIWLVGEICSNSAGCGVAGYAYFPSAHGGNNDGIVQEARWFGTTNGTSAVQIHEMGHYLGLYHTFQGACTNNDCLADGDQVCDTPPDNSTAPVPCGGTINSCSTDIDSGFATNQNDMYWNYMDYGDWDCYSAFTDGQRERMHWHIENVRSSLLESNACNNPCTVNITADFLPNTQTINIGTTLYFSNSADNATNYDWRIDGVSFASSTNANYTFNTLGTFEIMLLSTNTDPNCHAETSITVTVVCPIIAAFSTSNLYPVPGEIVTFTNETTNATVYDWQINSITQSNGQNLNQTFPTEGIYTICLQTTNNLCTQQFCQTIFVSTGGGFGDCEEETFVKIIGEPNQDEGAYTIIPSGDGNFYVGGYETGNPLLLKISTGGAVLWKRSFLNQGTQPMKEIDQIIIDSEGLLVMIGRGGSTAENRRGLIFKYNPVTDNILWIQHIDNPSHAYSVIEPIGSSLSNYYIVIGGTPFNTAPGYQDDAYFMKIDKITGELTNFTPKNYNLGGSDSFYSSLFFNNKIYSGGRFTNINGVSKMRFSLTEMDIDGNVQWSKLYHIATDQSARLYGIDILIEEVSIFLLGYGDDDGVSNVNTDPFFIKTDMDGNVDWVRKYQLFDIGGVDAREIISVSDGFVIIGISTQGTGVFFLLKVNKEGEKQWVKSYDTGGGELLFYPQSQLLTDGAFIYFVAETVTGNNHDALIVKTDLEGNTVDECIAVQDINVMDFYVQNPITTAVSLTEYDSQNQLVEGNIITESFGVAIDGCGCVQDSLPCKATFIKTIGTGNEEESGQKIIAEPNGGFLLGGSRGDSTLIMLLDENAETIWARTFKFINLSATIRDMFIDSDGYLIGIGYSPTTTNNKQTYVFKYDYINDNILWAKELVSTGPSRLSFYSIIENEEGGNYFISGATWNNAGQSGCDGMLLEVERNTGNGLWYNSYDLGSCEHYFKLISIANSLYTFGRNNASAGGENKFRGAISQFDLTGNELWSKLYIKSTQENARLYFIDAVDDNGLVALGYGDLEGTNLMNNTIHLVKIDYAGNAQWAKKYNVSSTEIEYSRRIMNLPDGYLLLGYYNINEKYSIFLMKTDKNGEVQWTKKYGGVARDFGYDIFYQNGFIYLLGETENYGLGNAKNIFLAKLKLDGSIPGDCIIPEGLLVIGEDIINPYDGMHPLTQYDAPVSLASKTVSSNETHLVEQLECYVPCEEIDSCLLLPDANLILATATCLGENLHVSLEVCNIGNGLLPTGTFISFYDGNPTNSSASLLLTSTFPQDLHKNDCVVFDVILSSSPVSPIFVMLNDDGSTPTPFNLEEDFSNATVGECNFLNNLGSFDLDYTSLMLDLGPDIEVCDNTTLTFDAGSGFYSYRWFDGSTAQTYSAWEAGTFWVEVTDECGGTQIDYITVTVLPASILDLGPDTLICAGTITLTATGFDNYQWFPVDLVDCPTCSTVEITIDETTAIKVVGEIVPGCYSVDTILIEIIETPTLTLDDIIVCPGDFGVLEAFSDLPAGIPEIYEWTINNVVVGNEATLSTEDIDIESTTEVTLNYTYGDNCETINEMTTIVIIEDDFTVSLSANPNVVFIGDSTVLIAVIQADPPLTGELIYTWYAGEDEIGETSVSTFTVSNIQGDFDADVEQIYTVIATSIDGCAAEAMTTVIIKKPDLTIPNVFTPNGDGLNDIFKVYHTGGITVTLTQVFNRWGEMVFESVNNEMWNGTYKGKIAQSDVYLYRVEYSRGEKIMEKSGEITLLR